MTADPPSVVEEPTFSISRPPRFWPSPLGCGAVFAVLLALVCAGASLVVLVARPGPVVTIRGIMASKQDFFNDEKVQDLLLEHHIRVEVTPRGSGEVAAEVLGQKTESYDFAFPSGQPAADLIRKERSRRRLYNRTTYLFTSPIVLASYREYAETLVRRGVAERHSGGPGDALYYTLKTAEFVESGRRGETWNDIGIKGITNGNRVLARTAGVCRSNSGLTYLGLVAYVVNGGKPVQTEIEADQIAKKIGPLITGTGMPESELFSIYVTPEGKSQGPIVVVYEHQFFAYQQEHRRNSGRVDTERVLLYPEQEFQTDPAYISLKRGNGDRLGQLLRTDPGLRRRMMELGFRVVDDPSDPGTRPLYGLLEDNGVPVPDERTDYTRAELPKLDLLQRLADQVDGCR
ncbi:hypothetical protein ACIBI3_11265 [Actinomadura luteofluorescens]|uniref:hypothetical protein n=1 Tax=Actinomadura luteofluorescens TaxID=46163 RepID=UPI0034844ECA